MAPGLRHIGGQTNPPSQPFDEVGATAVPVKSMQRAKSSTLMWRFVLPPVFVVAALWITMSTATNFYMQWIEDSHRQVFDENVVSIAAAKDLQKTAHRLEAMWPESKVALLSIRPLWNVTLQDLEEHVSSLLDSSHTSAEQLKTHELMKLHNQLRADNFRNK